MFIPATWPSVRPIHSLTMNLTIQQCLSLVPVPGLSPAFAAFALIWSTAKQIEASKEQLKSLVQTIAQLLGTLDHLYHSGKLSETSTVDALSELTNLIDEISRFAQRESCKGFFKLLLSHGDRTSAIDGYYRRISYAINGFQIVALSDIQDWQGRNEQARLADQNNLHTTLRQLESNQRLLIKALDMQHNNLMAMMVALRRRIDEQQGDEEEIHFFSHSLHYLMASSGQHVDRSDLQPWTITSFDVEFGSLIGAGGYGRVYRGKWNQLEVALKVIKTADNIAPTSSAIRRETWSKLRHPHILQFLGANVLDLEPFIVMPWIKGGNAREYINKHPRCDRLKIIQHISLGLTYLHSQRVIHGDLKACNVLIDEGERALLCDFGLARIKADIHSRTINNPSSTLQGSLNWMAPELFEGESFHMPCDIYSFAMTMYEIYTNEIPFGSIPPIFLPDIVSAKGRRPARPIQEDASQLTDDAWKLMQECWASLPSGRPIASEVCERLVSLLPYINSTPAKLLKEPGNMTSQIPPNESDNYAIIEIPDFRITIVPATHVSCMAQSADGKTLVTGHTSGYVTIWNALAGFTIDKYYCFIPLPQGQVHFPRMMHITSVVCPPGFTFIAGSLGGTLATVARGKGLQLLPMFGSKKDRTIDALGCINNDIVSYSGAQRQSPNVALYPQSLSGTPTLSLRSDPYDLKTAVTTLAQFRRDDRPKCSAISPNGCTLCLGYGNGDITAASIQKDDNGSINYAKTDVSTAILYFQEGVSEAPQRSSGLISSFFSSTKTRPSEEGQTTCKSLAFSPKGKLLACYQNGEIRIWDLQTQKYKTLRTPRSRDYKLPEMENPLHPPNIFPVSFSRKGSTVVYPSLEKERSLEVQDVDSGAILKTISLPNAPSNFIDFLALSPDKNHCFIW